MTRYKIEKTVPNPKPGAGRPCKYPFYEMTPGDSFKVSKEEVLSASQAAHQFGRRHGQKYTIRTTPTGGRIWRVE